MTGVLIGCVDWYDFSCASEAFGDCGCASIVRVGSPSGGGILYVLTRGGLGCCSELFVLRRGLGWFVWFVGGVNGLGVWWVCGGLR